MTNKFYPKGAEKVLKGSIQFETDTINVALVPSTYTFSEAHEFISDLGVSFIGNPKTLANKSVEDGTFDADDVDFGALAAGSTVMALVIYKSAGGNATSPLLCYLDEVTGFPFNTNGGEISIPWSQGSAKIFSLV